MYLDLSLKKNNQIFKSWIDWRRE